MILLIKYKDKYVVGVKKLEKYNFQFLFVQRTKVRGIMIIKRCFI